MSPAPAKRGGGRRFAPQVSGYIHLQIRDLKKTSRTLKQKLDKNSLDRVVGGDDQFCVEQIHRFRVAVRKLRSVFFLVSLRPEYLNVRKKLKRDLKLFGQVSGKCRELDVVAELASSYGMLNERKSRQKVFKIRHDARLKLLKLLNSKVWAKTYVDLDLLSNLNIISNNNLVNVACDKLRKGMKYWNSKNLKKKNQFHQLRIFAKKTRYSLEAFGFTDKKLEKLQEKLGSLHDLETLKRHFGTNSKVKYKMKKLKKKVNSVQDRSFDFALSIFTSGE